VGAGRVGDAHRADLHPVVAVTTQLADEVEDRPLTAYGDDTAHAPALQAESVDSAAQGVAVDGTEHDGGRDGDDHQPPGDVDPQGVGEEGDDGHDDQAGLRQAAELLAAGAEDAAFVPPGQVDHEDPAQRDEEDERGGHRTEALARVEDVGEPEGQQHRDQVAEDRRGDVTLHPATRVAARGRGSRPRVGGCRNRTLDG